MTGRAANSASGILDSIIGSFASEPAAQMTSNAGAELGALAAKKAGLGTIGAMILSVLGSVAGGKVAPGESPSVAASVENTAETLASKEEAAARAVEGAAAEAKTARTVEDAITGEAAAAKSAKSIAPKPDEFALTPGSVAQAVEKSPYTKHAGQVLEVEAKELGWSQTTVSYNKSRPLPDGKKIEYTYDDIKDNLYNNGWPKGDPDEVIDVVIMPPDGKLTSIDNSRLTAIHELGGVDKHGRPIKPEVRIRRPDEKLSVKDKRRFTKAEKGIFPETWGEATRGRIRSQNRQIPGQENRLEQPPRVTNRPK